MSQVNELLNNMTEEELALYTANPETESHIVVNGDRTIIIPSELKKIAVQYDHDVETVTFDCPRYWDGLDMSTMIVYINYKRADGYLGSYIADNVRVSETDENIMNFEWTLSRNVTLVKGNLSFLICVKKTDENGEEVNHWNSELNREMVVSEGLECTPDIVEAYPDIITQLLMRMDNVAEIKTEAMPYIATLEMIVGNAIAGPLKHNGEEIEVSSLYDAYALGRAVFVVVHNREVYTLTCVESPDDISFSRIAEGNIEIIKPIDDSIDWTRQVITCEDASNKVVQDDNFEDYTGLKGWTKYPSMQCMISYVKSVVGDIETALDNIIDAQNELTGGDVE